ncbi:hypothetical protein DFQ28_004745 [Apophysomyces sp. BC1034]|nr:hypothetical protein DFQ29_009760 [Apophysomyces sp. BC1021]KAG0188510.1 hypothetical protein DFQ28_004745 [Apophysomyces sp. BC1034]
MTLSTYSSQDDIYDADGQVTPPSSPLKDFAHCRATTSDSFMTCNKRIRSPTSNYDEGQPLAQIRRRNSLPDLSMLRRLSAARNELEKDATADSRLDEHAHARSTSEPPPHIDEDEIQPGKSKVDQLFEDDIPPPNFVRMNPDEYEYEGEDEDLNFPLIRRPVSLVDGKPIRQSLLDELSSVLSRDYDDDDGEDSFLSSPRRIFGDAKLGSEGVDGHPRLASCTRPRSSLPNFYDDEVDAFFSSYVDEQQESSTTRANRLQNSMRNEFLTEWPHFLTNDYFTTHGPDNWGIDREGNESRKATTYFDTTFSILKCLGSGEFAEVWKVRHVGTGKLFAIKQTKTPFLSCDDRWRQIIEVDHMRAVKGSSNCIDVVDAWEQEGYLFVQMELCDNGSLSEYISLKRDIIDEQTMWDLMYETATNTKLIKGEGDRRYMAPDLLREQFDKPADIFSLGLIFLEMAAKVVLPDTGESWEALRLSNFSDYKMQGVSHELQELIKWMLTPYPNERPTIYQVLSHDRLIKVAERRRNLTGTGVLFDYVLEMENTVTEESSSAENTFRTPEHRIVTWDTC